MKVILVRHGEKTGRSGDRELSAFGTKRSEFLATYVPEHFGNIRRLFSAENTSKSERPVRTLEPIAKRLSLPIEQWPTDDVQGLASTLGKYASSDGDHAVICWRHDRLKKLALALGARDAPEWKPAEYDAIWIVDMESGNLVMERQGSSPT